MPRKKMNSWLDKVQKTSRGKIQKGAGVPAPVFKRFQDTGKISPANKRKLYNYYRRENYRELRAKGYNRTESRRYQSQPPAKHERQIKERELLIKMIVKEKELTTLTWKIDPKTGEKTSYLLDKPVTYAEAVKMVTESMAKSNKTADDWQKYRTYKTLMEQLEDEDLEESELLDEMENEIEDIDEWGEEWE